MALQTHSSHLPAQHQVPKNGIHKSQHSEQNLPAPMHRKPQGRDVLIQLILLVLRMQPYFLQAVKRHFFSS